MCINRYKLVRPTLRSSLVVNCGKCGSCLQAKAIARTNKIKNHSSTGLVFFITLTYDNQFVPYINYDDIRISNVVRPSKGNPLHADRIPFQHVRIWRNSIVYYDRFGVKHVKHEPIKLASPAVDLDRLMASNMDYHPEPKHLMYHGMQIKAPRIGVCFFKDAQDFFKRLRINLNRNESTKHFNFKYFCCSEYGGISQRPHFHALLFTNEGTYEMWQSAICKAWPFSRLDRTKKGVEIAINAASYVSAYVNSSSTLPALFTEVADFKPKHSHSKGFGFGKVRAFSFEEVCKAIYHGDLHYNCQRTINNTLVNVPVLLPKYVITRYFPKFKGYNLLTPNEITDLFAGFKDIQTFYRQLRLSTEDCHRIRVMLRNRRLKAAKAGLYPSEYGLLASRVWSLYSAQSLGDWYSSNFQSIYKQFYNYDNITDYYDGVVSSPSLDSIVHLLPSNFKVITDLNEFPDIVLSSDRLMRIYLEKDKYKKDLNTIYYKQYNV